MAKKLFQNYDFEFDNNEKKILTTFCKQLVSQYNSQDAPQAQIRIFQTLYEKFNTGDNSMHLTKAEKTQLVQQLKENVKFLNQKMEKAWFFKKWMYRSLHSQYNAILTNHFN